MDKEKLNLLTIEGLGKGNKVSGDVYITQVSDLAFRQFVHMPVVLPASCCSR